MYDQSMYIMCLSKGVAAIELATKDGLLANKTLGFIPTAGDVYEDPYFVQDSRRRLERLGFKLTELDIAHKSEEALLAKLDALEGVYVAGGNSFYLLQEIRRKNLYEPLIKKVREGMPYFGESAGAGLLAQSIEPATAIDDPSKAPDLTEYSGLGIIDFFPLPHVDREKYKAVFDKFLDDYESKIKIVKCRDDQAILTRDGKTYEILESAISAIN